MSVPLLRSPPTESILPQKKFVSTPQTSNPVNSLPPLQNIDEKNLLAGEVLRVRKILRCMDISTSTIDGLEKDAYGKVSETKYLSAIRMLGIPINPNKHIATQVALYFKDRLALKMKQDRVPFSTNPKELYALSENFSTYRKHTEEISEVRFRIEEIEKKILFFPEEIKHILFGPATKKKWDTLITWHNAQFKKQLPYSLTSENQSTVLPALISSIQKRMEAKSESIVQPSTYLHPLQTLHCCSTDEGRKKILLEFHIENNHLLSQSLFELINLDQAKLTPYLPLISHYMQSLSEGNVFTQDEIEQGIGTIIFLIDRNLDYTKIPQDPLLAHRHVLLQTIIELRKFQQTFETEQKNFFLIHDQKSVSTVHLPEKILSPLIASNGFLNFGIAHLIRRMLPKKNERDAPEERLCLLLSQLQSSKELLDALYSITAPMPKNPGYHAIQATLRLPKDSIITTADARKAVLVSLGIFHRQKDFNDCFTSSPLEATLELASTKYVEDIKELLVFGGVYRTYEPNNQQVFIPGFSWPNRSVCKRLEEQPVEVLVSLYDSTFIRNALLELNVPVSKEQWTKTVEQSMPTPDLRSIFLCFTNNIEFVQKALVRIEASERNPLHIMWQNMAASIEETVYTCTRIALKETLLTIGKGCGFEPKIEESLNHFYSQVRFCRVSQTFGPSSSEEFSLICLNIVNPKNPQLMDTQSLQKELFSAFIKAYPTLKIDPKILFTEYLAKLSQYTEGKTTPTGEIAGTIFIEYGGGWDLQNLFEKKIGCRELLYAPATDYTPKQLLSLADEYINHRKLPLKTAIPVANSLHNFRLTLSDKSLLTCLENPEKALEDQKKFADTFSKEQRPFSAWMKIYKNESLYNELLPDTLDPMNGSGTLFDFLEALSSQHQLSQDAKDRMQKQLCLRFLVHACNEAKKIPALHYGDSNWLSQKGAPVHFGVMYNPFSKKWEEISIDDKNTPSSLYLLTESYLTELELPTESVLRQIIKETSHQELLLKERSKQKEINHIERDFARIVSYMEHIIEHLSHEELSHARQKITQKTPQTAPQKYVEQKPQNFSQALVLAHELRQKYTYIHNGRIVFRNRYATALTASSQKFQEFCLDLIEQRTKKNLAESHAL